MKSIILVLVLIFAIPSFARVYVAGSISNYTQLDTTDEGDVNENLLLKGSGGGFYLGYRFSFLALEGFYKNASAEGEDGNVTFDFTNTMTGLGIRLYLFTYFNFKLGTMKNDASGDIKINNTTFFEFESTTNASYTGIGLRFPFRSFDFFGDVAVYAIEDDDADDAGIAFQELELGVRYYF